MNPSRAQMRMLHVLADGVLIFQSWPVRLIEVRGQKSEVRPDGIDESWQFHEVTARKIVERGWAELKKFNAQRGEYRITAKGKALSEAICDCVGRKGQRAKGIRQRMIDWHMPESTEWLAGKKLCVYCGRIVAES